MEGSDDLPPSEAARDRRRDRDADAHARAGMKTGLAKQFKQVLDAQVKRAREADGKSGDIGVPADRPTSRSSRRGRPAHRPPDQPPNVNE
jgi:hypothetical protein